MTEPQGSSIPVRTASDIAHDSWVLRLSPAAVRPYLKLARIDRPIGTWLLLFPCWWSLAMASAATGQWPEVRLLVLFAIGALVMRGAGCTYNDIVDRDLDARVARTATRPVASGQVSVAQAVLFLVLQALVGLAVLLQFNGAAILLGLASLLLVAVYPFMKRITHWPQAWLGLTFNWGALMGWAAVTGGLDWPALLLYAGGLFWTLGYDTIYAHQDREDDALIGVKSSALALGDATGGWLWVFYAAAAGLFLAAGLSAGLGWPHVAGAMAVVGHFLWQIRCFDVDDPAGCLPIFRANRFVGWLLLAGILASVAL